MEFPTYMEIKINIELKMLEKGLGKKRDDQWLKSTAVRVNFLKGKSDHFTC